MEVEKFVQHQLSLLAPQMQPLNFREDSQTLLKLGLDSFGFIALVEELERKFHFEFRTEDLLNPKLYTPKGLIAYVQNRMRELP